MKNIMSFNDWSMNEEFFGFGEEEEIDPNTQSKFLTKMTLGDLAKKFNVTPEYISEFEVYLSDNLDMGNVHDDDNIISEDEYEFHLKENFPETQL